MKIHPFNSRWLFLLFLLLPTLLFAKADIDGFKGMRWGSNLSDLQQTKKLVLTKEGGKSGSALYALENEELRFGKATLTGIQYSFTKERLHGVILLFTGGKNFAAMKAEAIAKFGESTKIELTGEEMYNWAGPITNTVLSYNQKSQSGFLFMKPKKMPPPTKAAEKRKTASPADLETALDKAPPPKVPATRPATSPADLETALDRAPPLPQQGAVETFPPEIQGLIDRDQALTQLCWETAGPAADAACVQMRDNMDRLKAMGLCVVPGASGPSGTEIVWRRCGPAAAAAPQSTVQVSPQPIPQGTSQMLPEAAAQQAIPQAAPPNDARNQLCRQIGELFTSAAEMRNNGVEPQIAEGELIWYQTDQFPEITIERIRETVELVYFDQSYAQASGDQLNQQVSRSCANKRGPYAQPLP
ncbi:hypothetical protein [uncultured Desulfobulbus sp.]|uniref:hypothetical protein n=1 Tax=uncultured Desulfobulbus sp. TaxID=239745 RepID=UPI0029C8E392|nr:hypothetical protein [uncultured Desulfobulbus sp.]